MCAAVVQDQRKLSELKFKLPIPERTQTADAEIAKKAEVVLSKRGARLLLTTKYIDLHRSRTSGKLNVFHCGLPALDEFPFDIWSRLVARRLRTVSMSLFGLGNSEGYLPLRVAVSDYLQTERAVRCRRNKS